MARRARYTRRPTTQHHTYDATIHMTLTLGTPMHSTPAPTPHTYTKKGNVAHSFSPSNLSEDAGGRRERESGNETHACLFNRLGCIKICCFTGPRMMTTDDDRAHPHLVCTQPTHQHTDADRTAVHVAPARWTQQQQQQQQQQQWDNKKLPPPFMYPETCVLHG